MKSPKSPESPTIITKSEPLVVGIPTNNKLAEDLKAFTDSLKLKGSQGRLVSPKFKDAVFRPLRAQDIAKFLCDGRGSKMDVGIVGTDTIIEEMLRNSVVMHRMNQWTGNVFARLPMPEQKVTRMADIYTPPTRLDVLIREEDEEKFQKWADGDTDVWKAPSPAVITAYPNIAGVAVLETLSDFAKRQIGETESSYSPCMANVIEIKGQIESILRNNNIVIPEVCFAFDIVRSGETARKFNLKTFGTSVLISRPGLYVKDARYADKLPKNQLEDFMAFVREQFKRADLDFSDLVKRDPFEEIEPWKSPFPLKPKREKTINYGKDVPAGNVSSEEQLRVLESLIGPENVKVGIKLLRDGGVLWIFKTVEESDSNADLSDGEKKFCRERFTAGEKYAGITRTPRKERTPTLESVLTGITSGGYDSHGNSIGGGYGRKDSIH